MKKIIFIILILLVIQQSIEKKNKNPNGKKKLKKKITAESQTQFLKEEDISMIPQKMIRRTMAKTLKIEVECSPKECTDLKDQECIKIKRCKQKIDSKNDQFDQECCEYTLSTCTKNQDCKDNQVISSYYQNCCQMSNYSTRPECGCAFRMSRPDCFGKTDICKNCLSTINCQIQKNHFCCCQDDNCCDYHFKTGLNNPYYETCCKQHPDKEQCKCQYIMNHQQLFTENQVKACCSEFPQIHPCSCKDKFIAPDCCNDFNVLTPQQKQMCCTTPAFQSRKECCCYPCPPKDSKQAKECNCPNCQDDCDKLADIKKSNGGVIPFEKDINGQLKNWYCKCEEQDKVQKSNQYNQICNPCFDNPYQTLECCKEFFKFKILNIEDNQINYNQCCDKFSDNLDQCKCSYILKNPSEFLPSKVKECCKQNFDNYKDQCCEFVYYDLNFYPQKNELCHSCIQLPKNPPIDLKNRICLHNFFMRLGLKICDSYCKWCEHPDNCKSKDNCYTSCCQDYFKNFDDNKILPDNIIKKEVCCQLNQTPNSPLKDFCSCKDDMDKSDCNQIKKCCNNDDAFKQKNIKDCNKCNCNDQITPDDEQCCDQILKNNLFTYNSYKKCCEKNNNCCDCQKDPTQNCCCPNPQTTLPIKDIQLFQQCCQTLQIKKLSNQISEIPQQCDCDYQLKNIDDPIFASVKQQILEKCCKNDGCKYDTCKSINCCKDGKQNDCCTENDYKTKSECCNKDPFNKWCPNTCEQELKKLKGPCEIKNQIQNICCDLPNYKDVSPCANLNNQCCCNLNPFDPCCCQDWCKNYKNYQNDNNNNQQITQNLGQFQIFKQQCCIDIPDCPECCQEFCKDCNFDKPPQTQDKLCCTKIQKGTKINDEWLNYCCNNFKDVQGICPCNLKLKYPKCCSEKQYFNSEQCCDNGAQNDKQCCNYKFDPNYCCGKEKFYVLTNDQQKQCCDKNYNAELCCSIDYKKETCCNINNQFNKDKCCDDNTLEDLTYKEMCCPQYKEKLPDKRAQLICQDSNIIINDCNKEPKPCYCYGSDKPCRCYGSDKPCKCYKDTEPKPCDCYTENDKPCSCYKDQPYKCCLEKQSPLYCFCQIQGNPSIPPCLCLQNTYLTIEQEKQCCDYYNYDSKLCKCFNLYNKYPNAELTQIKEEDKVLWSYCCNSLKWGNKESCGKCDDCQPHDCWGDNGIAIHKPKQDNNYQSCCADLVMNWDIFIKQGKSTSLADQKKKCCSDIPELQNYCPCEEKVIKDETHPDHQMCCSLPQFTNRKECNCGQDVLKDPKSRDYVSCCKAHPKEYCTKDILKDPNHILFNCCCEANTPEPCCSPANISPSISITDPLKQYCCKKYQYKNSCCQELDYLKGAKNRDFCCSVAPTPMCCETVKGCKQCEDKCESNCCTQDEFNNLDNLRHNECCLKYPDNPQCNWKKVPDCKKVLAQFTSYPIQQSENALLFYDCCNFCKKYPKDSKCPSDVPDSCNCPGYQECQSKNILTQEVTKCCQNDKIAACDCKCLPNFHPNNEYCCQIYSPTGKCPCSYLDCPPSSFKNANDPKHDYCCNQIKNDLSKQTYYENYCAPPTPCVDCIQNLDAQIQAQEYFNTDGFINARGRMKKNNKHSRFNKNKYYTLIKNKTNHQSSQNII